MLENLKEQQFCKIHKEGNVNQRFHISPRFEIQIKDHKKISNLTQGHAQGTNHKAPLANHKTTAEAGMKCRDNHQWYLFVESLCR